MTVIQVDMLVILICYFAHSKEPLTEALDACPPEVIRCLFQCADRYASAYSQGATGLLAEYTVKKYRSHRSVSAKGLVDAHKKREDHDSRLKHSFNHNLQ